MDAEVKVAGAVLAIVVTLYFIHNCSGPLI